MDTLRARVTGAITTWAILISLVASHSADAQSGFAPVVVSGQAAPGTPAGVVFGGIYSTFNVNASGNLLFHASVTGPGVTSTNDTGLWLNLNGSNFYLIREGDNAAGTNAQFAGFTYQGFADDNRAMFMASLTGQSINAYNRTGVWYGTPQGLQLWVRDGNPAPGTNSTFLMSPGGGAKFNAQGSMTLQGYTFNSGSGGVWSGAPGTANLVAFGGNTIPNTNLQFDSIPLPFAITPDFRSLFGSSLKGSGVDSTNDFAIFRGSPGQIEFIARHGDRAPGQPANETWGNLYSSLGGARLANSSGAVAFTADIKTDGQFTNHSASVWRGEPGSLQLVVRQGDSASAEGPGWTFGAPSNPWLTDSGKIVFRSSLSGSSSTIADSLWIGEPGNLAEILRVNQQAPGTDPGVTFRGIAAHVVGADDTVYFTAFLAGPGITSANDKGVWSWNALNGYQLLLRTGDVFDLDPGVGVDARTLADINSFTKNASGEHFFYASFTDGSSAIMATVPEPTTLALLSVSIAGALVVCRRQRISHNRRAFRHAASG